MQSELRNLLDYKEFTVIGHRIVVNVRCSSCKKLMREIREVRRAN